MGLTRLIWMAAFFFDTMLVSVAKTKWHPLNGTPKRTQSPRPSTDCIGKESLVRRPGGQVTGKRKGPWAEMQRFCPCNWNRSVSNTGYFSPRHWSLTFFYQEGSNSLSFCFTDVNKAQTVLNRRQQKTQFHCRRSTIVNIVTTFC